MIYKFSLCMEEFNMFYLKKFNTFETSMNAIVITAILFLVIYLLYLPINFFLKKMQLHKTYNYMQYGKQCMRYVSLDSTQTSFIYYKEYYSKKEKFMKRLQRCVIAIVLVLCFLLSLMFSAQLIIGKGIVVILLQAVLGVFLFLIMSFVTFFVSYKIKQFIEKQWMHGKTGTKIVKIHMRR